MPAKVVTGGSVTLSARKLLEIVKELPAAALTLKVQENSWVAMRCGGASYKLVGLSAAGKSAESPNLPAVGNDGQALQPAPRGFRTPFRFASDEYSTAASRPQLVITFAPCP